MDVFKIIGDDNTHNYMLNIDFRCYDWKRKCMYIVYGGTKLRGRPGWKW